MFQGPNMWSTPAVWKQYNKMTVLHFFLVNSPLIYILFSLGIAQGFTVYLIPSLSILPIKYDNIVTIISIELELLNQWQDW